jgi:4-nitrophenyl phosphatase
MNNLKYKAILADLDGTVNRGSLLIPGVRQSYEKLKNFGIHWLFLSNNATVQDVDLCENLKKWGLLVDPGQVINSASVLFDHLQGKALGINLMVVGQPRLVEGCLQAGASITDDPKKTEAVVVGLDRHFTYDKMRRAHKAIQAGAHFWATNLDVTFPDEENFSPGAGSVVASIATAAGVQPEKVFGKPSADMAEMALLRTGVKRSECLMVGDRIDTDLLCARNAGMDCAMVLSGASTRRMIEECSIKPEYIIEDISCLEHFYE